MQGFAFDEPFVEVSDQYGRQQPSPFAFVERITSDVSMVS
jgi:hypothetical protein